MIASSPSCDGSTIFTAPLPTMCSESPTSSWWKITSLRRIAPRAHERGKRLEAVIANVGEERASAEAIDRQGVIGHELRISSRRGHSGAAFARTLPPPRSIRQGPKVSRGRQHRGPGDDSPAIRRMTRGTSPRRWRSPRLGASIYLTNVATTARRRRRRFTRCSHPTRAPTNWPTASITSARATPRALHRIAQDRQTDAIDVDRAVQRRITSRRLAATAAAAALTFAIAATAAANQPAEAAPPRAGNGGSVTLIR